MLNKTTVKSECWKRNVFASVISLLFFSLGEKKMNVNFEAGSEIARSFVTMYEQKFVLLSSDRLARCSGDKYKELIRKAIAQAKDFSEISERWNQLSATFHTGIAGFSKYCAPDIHAAKASTVKSAKTA